MQDQREVIEIRFTQYTKCDNLAQNVFKQIFLLFSKIDAVSLSQVIVRGIKIFPYITHVKQILLLWPLQPPVAMV